jgi:TolB-like protein/Tfp pilus assembly protein PilF
MRCRPARKYLVPDSDGSAVATSDVFVSYASQDAAIANAVVAALERHRLKCWIAPRDVTPGALYADGIISAINGTRVLVLVLSANSIASPHVGKEVERASSKRRPIITLRTDGAPLTSALEYFLSESQWIDLAADGTDAAFAKLLTAVRRQAGAAPEGHSLDHPMATDRRSATQRPPPRLRRSWLLAAALIVIGVAVAWLATDRLRSSTAARQAAASTQPVEAAFAPPPRSIAVLPFVNMSGDASQDYFSDGISEELLNSLSRLNDLQVVARTSSFSFKGQNVDVATIAHKLNVGAVLEGSVRRAGNTVRITVQLINAVTGFHIWSQTYDRQLSDILKVQTDVATAVAQQLEVKLAGNETAVLELGSTSNPAAYEAYLRGSELLSNGSTATADLRAALAALDQAIALDPNYALAHARRAIALTDISIFVDLTPAEIAAMRAQARQAAERAVALAPELGDAHVALADVLSVGLLDFAAAAPEFDRALALSPGSARVQMGFAAFAGQLGHSAAAVSAARRAASLDPRNGLVQLTLGQVLTFAGQYGEALTALRAAKGLLPNSDYVNFNIANTMLAAGQFEQARVLCESMTAPSQAGARHLLLALAYHGLKRQADAENEAAQIKALIKDQGSVELAGVYAQLGDKAAALEQLALAEQHHDPAFQVLRVAWQLEPIRNEPQFKAIEARMKFPP